jgi:hypothetical protein
VQTQPPAMGQFFTFASRFPQFVILLIGQLKRDFPRLSLDQHREDVLVFERLRATGALDKLEHIQG